MKRAYTLVTLAALAAMVSCVREEEQSAVAGPETGKAPVTFHANLGAASKTIINDSNAVSWAEGDKLTVFDAAGNSEEFTVDQDCEQFTFTSDGTLTDGPFYAVAGYGAAVPAFDTQTRQIGIGLPGETTDGTFGGADLIASMTEGDTFTFHHALAVLKMSLESEDVQKLTFEAEGITSTGNTLIGFDSEGALDVTYDKTGNSITIENIQGAGTYYFAVNPGTYADGFTIYLTYPDKKMKIQGKALTAALGKMVNFGTLDSGTPASTVWSLVTDASSLAAGDEIIIASSGYNYALGTTQNSNNRSAAAITKSDDKSELVSPDGSSVQVITLTAGSTSGTFGLYTDAGYLYAASSSKNYLRSQATLDANASWSISITSEGEATIKASGTYTRNTIYYNTQSTLFSCYSSSGQQITAVSIYKKVTTAASGPQMSEVNAFLDETAWGAYLYDESSDTVTPLYQYEIRNGAECTGADQYAVGGGSSAVSFRVQCFPEGKMAGVVLSTSSLEAGSSYSASATFWGLEGLPDGTSDRTFVVKKVVDKKAWLLEDDGTTGLIISTK